VGKHPFRAARRLCEGEQLHVSTVDKTVFTNKFIVLSVGVQDLLRFVRRLALAPQPYPFPKEGEGNV
jgi:hypothetical protein